MSARLFLPRPFPWACRWPTSVVSSHGHPLGVCVLTLSSYKATSQMGPGSPKCPHFTLITSEKALFPNTVMF